MHIKRTHTGIFLTLTNAGLINKIILLYHISKTGLEKKQAIIACSLYINKNNNGQLAQ